LLLIGFAGALRRSELVAFDVGDVEHVHQGIVITLRRSKTDQDGQGRKIGIPFGRRRWCPVAAFDAWLAVSGIVQGAIFRSVDRHRHVLEARLSGEAVSLVVRERVAAVALEPTPYSGHSLRAGLATSAAQAGLPAFSRCPPLTSKDQASGLVTTARNLKNMIGVAVAGQFSENTSLLASEKD
jgi:integrase